MTNMIYLTSDTQSTAYYPLHRVLKMEMKIPLTPAPGSKLDLEPGAAKLAVTLADLVYFMEAQTEKLKALSVEDTAPDERSVKPVITVVVKDVYWDGNKWNKDCGCKGDWEGETIECDLEVCDFGQILAVLDCSEIQFQAYREFAEAFNTVYGWDDEEDDDDDEDDVESRAQAAADNDEEGQRIMQEEATQDVLDEEARQEAPVEDEEPLDAESLEAFNQAMEKDD